MPLETLYKYRSLADRDNFKYFVDIILNNRLYAANYKELNDPIEGHYLYNPGELEQAFREKLNNDKSELRICSLSMGHDEELGHDEDLMWTHYADGGKGVVIEVTIDCEEYTVHPIEYGERISISNQDVDDQTAIKILSRKLNKWKYEGEKRVFVKKYQEGETWINVQINKVTTGRSMSEEDYIFIEKLIQNINPSIVVKKA